MKPEQSSDASWLDQRIFLAITFPFFTLLTPFAVYIAKHDYPLMSSEVLLILVGMLCASTVIGLLRWARGRWIYAISVSGLLLIAADYQFDWLAQGRIITLLVVFGVLVALMRRFEKTLTLVLTAFLCVFVISTFMRHGFESKPGLTVAASDRADSTNGRSRLIHLILDEHLGIEGIPTDTDYAREVKRKLRQFYQRYGFELYGGAYSHYFETLDSIPNLVNFSAESVNRVLVPGKRPPYVLQRNRYFEFLQGEGYQIHVMDGDFLDFCASQHVQLRSCTKYRWHILGSVEKLALPEVTKMTTLLATFVASYPRYQGFLNLYEQRVRPFMLSWGGGVPILDRESLWTRRHLQPFSVNTMEAMNVLSERIQDLSSGHALFAHLLLPHFPYVFRENCSARAISESMDNMEAVPLEFRTSEMREVRFDQYLRQVECLYVKLDELFQKMQMLGIFDSSIIIIHGDHGARLGLRDPQSKSKNQLEAADYADGLSTLFAAKVPGKSGGYDPSLHALNELFVQTLGNAFGNGPSLSLPRREPFAYLIDGYRSEQLLVDMPWRPLSVPDSPATVH